MLQKYFIEYDVWIGTIVQRLGTMAKMPLPHALLQDLDDYTHSIMGIGDKILNMIFQGVWLIWKLFAFVFGSLWHLMKDIGKETRSRTVKYIGGLIFVGLLGYVAHLVVK